LLALQLSSNQQPIGLFPVLIILSQIILP